MENWELLISCKVAEQEILALTPDLRSRFLHISDLLVKLGANNIGMPHIKPLENKMWEMRLKRKSKYS